MEQFNEDEKELLELISSLEPYDVMQVAVNQNGTRLSVTIKNNRQRYREFNLTKREKQ